jgi:alpha-glucosidase
MKNWKNTFRSEVSPQFISPYPPLQDQDCTILAQVVSNNHLLSVVCNVLSDGRTHRYPMHRLESNGNYFDRYETIVKAPYVQPWCFYFELDTDEGFLFYTRWGLQIFHPAETRLFRVDASLVLADWVPQSTFYQIFPDRFKKGSPELGVREGEYTFDGHQTKELAFGEKPLEYPQGWCLDFYNGDLQGIIDAIPHFSALGVTALYLNPIFRARTNHRYDCTDFFHVDEHLGGDEALIALGEALHAAGMRLMLDVSINHTGIDHPWFLTAKQDFRSEEAGFYYRQEDGSFDYWANVHTLPQLNYSSGTLQDFMWKAPDSVVRRYLKPPYGIDAWRFDVGTETGRNKEHQICHEIWREVRSAIKMTKPDAYVIGEAWEDASPYLQGDQWDSAMNYFGSGRLLRRWYGQQETYLMSNWGHSDESAEPLTGIELSDAINQHLHSIPDQLVYQQFNLIDSHDTARLHNHLRIFDWDLYRGVVMLLYVLPGTPSIYYGDEIGLDGHIFNNEGARYSMEWDEQKWDRRFIQLYRDLGMLRKNHSCIGYGGYRILHADEETMIFARCNRQEAVILVLNRALSERSILIDGTSLGIYCAINWKENSPLEVTDCSFTCKLSPRQSELYLCLLRD